MKWCIDIDSVISANPQFFSWLTYHLEKNQHKVYIVTGRNPKRENETRFQLDDWHIYYDDIYFMPFDLPRDFKSQAEWKVATIKKIKPNLWIDDNFKIYKEVMGVDTDIKGVSKIEI